LTETIVDRAYDIGGNLNKRPHLGDAVGALDDILQRMQDHQVKKGAMLRRLKPW
jgi:pyruvate kinase